eukprot:Gregarina_sp_Pseudo_9__1239@NODE_181_length_3804_cov_17_433201_g167_i0_p1_GENE_NODE_181_length_3804_cov_17_433201_g167_i0NODE_181_length_3804_cov_17_433201_g167_i0_p1_ORF_typecomplete_len685_score123_83Peptidase_C14/PF00656_22/1e33_NODE_181_length_3804_cov_17_433201_g167_i013343388
MHLGPKRALATQMVAEPAGKRSDDGTRSRRSKSANRRHSQHRHQQKSPSRKLHQSEPRALEPAPDGRAPSVPRKAARRRSCSQEGYRPWPGVERPLRRRPRRRAVVVGCNYSCSNAIRLRGCVNDAHLFALALTNLFEFHPQNILLLTDELPDPVFLASDDAAALAEAHLASSLPIRTHILLGLRWLTMGAIPGDILVFYFAGHGLQIDNMAGWEGEGYDECILPLDSAHTSSVNAITAMSIRQTLLSVDESVQLSIFLDCTGGQTMLDPAGTGTWRYIKGVKQKGLWPFVTDPTFKMERARYDPTVWTAESMRKKEVRPRFVPGEEVGNTQDLVGAIANPSFENPSTKLRGFHICAAPWDEVAVEGRLPSMGIRALSPDGTLSQLPVITANKAVIHGVFTWSLVRAMNDCAIGSAKAYSGDKTISFRTLMRETIKNAQFIKDKQGFSKTNQVPAMTYYMASGSSPTDLVFYPFGGRSKTAKYSDATELVQLNRKEPTWLPRREEYMTGWQAEAALMINGKQAQKVVPWRAQHSEYKQYWRAQVDNDPKYVAAYLERQSVPQCPTPAYGDGLSPPTPSESTAAPPVEINTVLRHSPSRAWNPHVSMPGLVSTASAVNYSNPAFPSLPDLTRSLTRSMGDLRAAQMTNPPPPAPVFAATGRSSHPPWFRDPEPTARDLAVPNANS